MFEALAADGKPRWDPEKPCSGQLDDMFGSGELLPTPGLVEALESDMDTEALASKIDADALAALAEH